MSTLQIIADVPPIVADSLITSVETNVHTVVRVKNGKRYLRFSASDYYEVSKNSLKHVSHQLCNNLEKAFKEYHVS